MEISEKMQDKKSSGKGNKKQLFIEVEKSPFDVMLEYANHINPKLSYEIGFNYAKLIGDKKENILFLTHITQVFFFAGIYYAHKYPNKYKFTKKTEKEIQEKTKEFEERIKKQFENPQKPPANYMG